MTIGEQIKIIRTAKGMKQKDLAAASYLTASYISKIESGKSRPARESVANIAFALDVSPQDLLCVEYETREEPTLAEQIKRQAQLLPSESQTQLLEFLKSISGEKTAGTRSSDDTKKGSPHQ